MINKRTGFYEYITPPAQMPGQAEWKREVTAYSNLRGVDFSVDPSLVDKTRSPYCPNIISDEGGNPVKRVGWRILHYIESPCNGLFFAEIDGVDYYVAHGGTKIYMWNDTAENAGNSTNFSNSGISEHTQPVCEEIYNDVNNARSTAFFFRENGKDGLYIMTGREYLVFDGETVSPVSDNAKVPVILISRLPTGGGTPYEAVNLLTPWREEDFLGNDTDTVFQLSANDIDSDPVTVEVTTSGGDRAALDEGLDFTVDRVSGTVTFPNPLPPQVPGEDNVFITYSKTIDGYADRIQKCTVRALYGAGGDNRVFVSGNPDYKAYDWYSGIFAPSYFPDIAYEVIGGDDTSVIGYHKLGEYLAIIKEDNNQDTTLFLRSAAVQDLGFNEYDKAVFSTQPGITGIGAVSKYSFVNLNDEPLFLSRNGIHGITLSPITYQRALRNRSYLLDRKMLNEDGLENACACEFNRYYILAVNGRCYILDGRHKTANNNRTDTSIDYIFEAYYWENVPAVCWLSLSRIEGRVLYFGTADGKICKFNYDIAASDMYSDGGHMNSAGQIEGGQAVVCQWATPNDADSGAHEFKSLVRRGCLAVLSPMPRTSGKIYYVIDGNPDLFVRMMTMDLFDWNDIDFERFTFESNESPQEIYFRRKVKRYKRLMIIMRNDVINEGFGIHEIIKVYTEDNLSRVK